MSIGINPDMIILARESRKMSQRKLAGEAKIQQAKLSKYENGLLEVTDSDLQAICIATRYRKQFFCSTYQIVGLGSSMLFNRKRQSTTIAKQREVQAKINIARIQIARMLRSVELESEHQFERLDPDSGGGSVRGLAQYIRAAWKLPMGPIRNVTEVIEAAGGVVILCDFGTDKIDGAHMWLPDMPPLFFMNGNVSGDRHRFNLAHELGHAIMHQFPTGDIEAEANEFASEFLMPSEEIRREFGTLTMEKLARLKQRWKVSMASMIYTAHTLGCISDHKYKMLFARLSSLGYRRSEPIEISMEQPTIINQLFEFYRNTLGYKDEEIRSTLMTDEPDLLQIPANFKLSPKASIDDRTFSFDEYQRKVD